LFCEICFWTLIEIFCFTLCLSLLSDGVCLLELKGLLTYLLTYVWYEHRGPRLRSSCTFMSCFMFRRRVRGRVIFCVHV